MKAFVCSGNFTISDNLCTGLSAYHDFDFEMYPTTASCINRLAHVSPELLLIDDRTDFESVIDFVKSQGASTTIFLVGSKSDESNENGSDGYISVSHMQDDIRKCAEDIGCLSEKPKHVRAVTFGRFDIFVDNEPVIFSSNKAKELLALCIDRRGGEVGMEEAIDKLWPNKSFDDRTKRLYRKAVTNLRLTLSKYEADYIFVKKRGCCYILSNAIECDYYRFLDDPEENLPGFGGEYLFDYPWGEKTLAMLIETAAKYGKELYEE